MSKHVEIRLPDIGDFKDVLIVEVLVKLGDEVAVDQSLIVLESDKATMDVPSSASGRVATLEVAPGQRASKGALIATISALAGRSSTSSEAPSPTAGAGRALSNCDLLVIGGGPGGYSAAFRAADLGLRVVLVERSATLGGVCLNVGCIPSKALLHVAAVKEEAAGLAEHGVQFGVPVIDPERLRSFKDGVIGKLTHGLSSMARMRQVEVVRGEARFKDASSIEIALPDGNHRTLNFTSAVIAVGSSSVRLPFLPADTRIVDSTEALELPFVPQRMLVIGGGIIGLEMATVYGSFGASVDVVEKLDGLLAGVDRDAVAIWKRQNERRVRDVFVGSTIERVSLGSDGVAVTIAGTSQVERTYDLVLQAVGRRPNTKLLGLEAAGITIDARGFIAVDRQMRTNIRNIFAIGDVCGEPMLAHKAVHEGHVAAEAAAGEKSTFVASVIPSVAYTNPEIAWVGMTEDGAKASGRKVKTATFPWAASGRALANGAAWGMTKLVFDPESRRVIGGAIVGPSAGDMIGEICLAIEMGAEAADVGKTIHPHPTLSETIGLAAEFADGTCTDLPPVKRQNT